jgi:hypothetical protein
VSLSRGSKTTGTWLALLLLALLLWPYRLESVESAVLLNTTGCTIRTTSNSGWREDAWTSRVAYPLKVLVFVESCAGVAEGRPHSAAVAAGRSGELIASNFSCAGARYAKGLPCRLELPRIDTLTGQDRFRVSVSKVIGQTTGTAELRLFIKRQWRSVALDALMSV